jgi:hypothetical protein
LRLPSARRKLRLIFGEDSRRSRSPSRCPSFPGSFCVGERPATLPTAAWSWPVVDGIARDPTAVGKAHHFPHPAPAGAGRAADAVPEGQACAAERVETAETDGLCCKKKIVAKDVQPARIALKVGFLIGSAARRLAGIGHGALSGSRPLLLLDLM